MIFHRFEGRGLLIFWTLDEKTYKVSLSCPNHKLYILCVYGLDPSGYTV